MATRTSGRFSRSVPLPIESWTGSVPCWGSRPPTARYRRPVSRPNSQPFALQPPAVLPIDNSVGRIRTTVGQEAKRNDAGEQRIGGAGDEDPGAAGRGPGPGRVRPDPGARLDRGDHG